MYQNIYVAAKEIISKIGGAREKEFLTRPHMFKRGTWNSEHKVVQLFALNRDKDGHRDGIAVDLVRRSICG